MLEKRKTTPSLRDKGKPSVVSRARFWKAIIIIVTIIILPEVSVIPGGGGVLDSMVVSVLDCQFRKFIFQIIDLIIFRLYICVITKFQVLRSLEEKLSWTRLRSIGLEW